MNDLTFLRLKELTLNESKEINGGDVSPFTKDLGRVLGIVIGVFHNGVDFTYQMLVELREFLFKSRPENNTWMMEIPALTLFG